MSSSRGMQYACTLEAQSCNVISGLGPIICKLVGNPIRKKFARRLLTIMGTPLLDIDFGRMTIYERRSFLSQRVRQAGC
jgi:hypothetical protein